MRGRYLKGNKLQADYASHECRAAFFEQCKNSGMDMKERSKPWEIHQPHLTAPNENSNSPDSTYRYSQIFTLFLSCPGRRQLSSSRNQPFRYVLLVFCVYCALIVLSRSCRTCRTCRSCRSCKSCRSCRFCTEIQLSGSFQNCAALLTEKLFSLFFFPSFLS